MSRAPLEIRRTPRAEQDLIEIWVYTARQWGERQADAYLDQLEDALRRLAMHPHIGAEYTHIGARLRCFGAGQHRFYYRVGDEAIEIIRVLHVSRDAAAQFEQ